MEPSKPGSPRLEILQLYDAAISGNPYPVKAVWFSFINFLNQCANSNKIAREVFPNLELIKVEKCNLCIHRIDQGLEPFCVICCEGQAMHFGDMNDPSSTLSNLVASRNTFFLKPEEGTSPSVHYCPPREPRRL